MSNLKPSGLLRVVILLACLGPVACKDYHDGVARIEDSFLKRKVAPDISIPEYPVQPIAPTKQQLVGVGVTEITPPPGYPTGGGGPGGGVTRGYWQRLYARAFYMEDKKGHRVAVVVCDLFAVPDALVAQALYLINQDPKVVHAFAPNWPANKFISLTAAELIVAANHVHQGPGNYMSAQIYNEFGSSYSGFDKDLFYFLARNVAGAIVRAMADAYQSAGSSVVIATHSLDDSFTAVGSRFTRNRAPRVFELNWDRDSVVHDVNPAFTIADCMRLCPDASGRPRDAQQRIVPPGSAYVIDEPRGCEPVGGWQDTADCGRLAAVNSRLTVVELKRGNPGSERAVGVLVFFAAHPTVLLPESPIYSTDFTGLAVSKLERELTASSGGPVVVGFFNGAEGDVHARRLRRDIRDVARVSDVFASAIRQALKSAAVLQEGAFDVSAVQREAQEPADEGDKPCAVAEWSSDTLALVAQYGVAGLGGGEDDRTILYDLGWREGVRGQPDNLQGPKLPALDSSVVHELRFTTDLAPNEHFPQRLPVTFARVGGLSIMAVPVEMTTAMGSRLFANLKVARDKTVLIGLANNYLSYNATPEEFVAQEYVGASTIWGPGEGPVLGCTLSRAEQGSQKRDVLIPAVSFGPLGTTPEKDFGLKFAGDPRAVPDEELGEILLDEQGRPTRSLPWFGWDEDYTVIPPTYISQGEFAAASLRLVEIQELAPDKTWKTRVSQAGADDDRGRNILTMLMDGKSSPNKRGWAALWAAAVLEGPVQKGTFRFRVSSSVKNLVTAKGLVNVVCSAPFPYEYPPAAGVPATKPAPVPAATLCGGAP